MDSLTLGEHISTTEKICVGVRPKLRFDLRKFFFNYGMKVRTWILKAAPQNSMKLTHGPYLDPKFLYERWHLILIQPF